MRKLDWKVVALTLGSFMTITYVLCILYGLLVPSRLHPSGVLEALLPGFTWLTAWSFVLGAVETFIYGVYAGALYSALYNFFVRRVVTSVEGRTGVRRAA